jgi:hypothetical protein
MELLIPQPQYLATFDISLDSYTHTVFEFVNTSRFHSSDI